MISSRFLALVAHRLRRGVTATLSCATVLAMLMVCHTSHAAVTITESNIVATAYNGSEFDDGFFQGTTVPTIFGQSNALISNGQSFNSINWTIGGGQTMLSFGIEHVRVGTQGAYSVTQGWVWFTVSENTSYDLSGWYSVTDVGSESGTVSSFVVLDDLTLSDHLFYGQQVSQSTPNEHFVVGATGGDSDTTLIGSLTGSLLEGHDYLLHFSYSTVGRPDPDSGASASGNVTLSIGTADPTGSVPEPAGVAVWSVLGLIACVGTWYRGKLAFI